MKFCRAAPAICQTELSLTPPYTKKGRLWIEKYIRAGIHQALATSAPLVILTEA